MLFTNLFVFFQAEDGIRDGHVTGVQTCALPISLNRTRAISDYINQIRTGKISVPSWKKFHPEFSSDFLNIRAELRGDDSVHFVRVGSDDALHAAIYAYVICKIYFASSGAGYSLF